jgi:tRNA (mo5U34)-methyltransferase
MTSPETPASARPETLAHAVAQLKWFHSIDFGNGIVSNGAAKRDFIEAKADACFRHGVAGKSVIDIGCWDGAYAFEAKGRGAARVLATDHFTWNHGWGDRRAFELGRAHLAPEVEMREIDPTQIDVETVGRFDLVLFLGVFYHLRHPFAVLERVAQLATETIVVETYLDASDIDRPAMIFYPDTELAADPTNWWGPNAACVIAMLRDLGFRSVEHTPTPHFPTRGMFHGQR